MSSLFNYELDEKQIRLTLHDAELEYNPLEWQDFDSNYSETVSKTNKNPILNLPKINLNINRNVLVPLFFIVGLGGVSAIMFKFINFKTKEPSNVQKALIPNAESINIVKKEIPPPIKNEPSAIEAKEKKQDTVVAVVNTPTQTLLSNTFVVNTNSTVITQPVQKNIPTLIDTSKSTSLAPPSITVNQNPYMKKRHRRRVTAEQLDVIKAQPLLSKDNSSAETEPELKIKTKDTPPD